MKGGEREREGGERERGERERGGRGRGGERKRERGEMGEERTRRERERAVKGGPSLESDHLICIIKLLVCGAIRYSSLEG